MSCGNEVKSDVLGDWDGYNAPADCDNNDASVYPGAPGEITGDDKDTDCDGHECHTDDFITEYYADEDSDGYYHLYTLDPSIEAQRFCPDAAAAQAGWIVGETIPDEDLDYDDGNADINVPKTYYTDADGDGYGDKDDPGESFYEDPGDGYSDNNLDNDDLDNTVYPGAEELCDEKDNNQDGTVDEGFTYASITEQHPDADGDGFGDPAGVPVEDCDPVAGYVVLADAGEDCDDTNGAVNPDADEECNGIDDDCDGLVDSEDPDILPDDEATWYLDSDGDGYGDDAVTVQSCDDPSDGDNTYVIQGGDWAPDEADMNPGTAFYVDADGDGFGDATASATYHTTDPRPDYVTNNYDWNDADDDITGDTLYYVDSDGDGDGEFGGVSYTGEELMTLGLVSSSSTPEDSGYSLTNYDFNDADSNVHSETLFYLDTDDDGDGDAEHAGYTAEELIDTLGVTDNPLTTSGTGYSDNNYDWDDDDDSIRGTTVYYEDADGDGDGDTSSSGVTGEDLHGEGVTEDPLNNGWSLNSDDPDDADDSVYGDTDFYTDSDGDGDGDFGATAVKGSTLSSTSGYSTNNYDFNDADTGVTSETVFYPDADLDDDGDATHSGYSAEELVDTYGVTSNPLTTSGTGYSDNNDDWDDGDDSITGSTNYYADGDGDGYGAGTGYAGSTFSTNPLSSGYSLYDTDCDDADENEHPGVASDDCDGADSDCDGSVDEDASTFTVYQDSDGDGFGDASTSEEVCDEAYSTLTDATTDDTDCDDSDSAVKPGATEAIGDGTDNNCDGSVEADQDIDDLTNALRFNGDDASDTLGISTFVMDTDADGYAEAIFGANGIDDGATDAGGVYIVSGPVTASSSAVSMGSASGVVRLDGPNASDEAGFYVKGSRDIDDDGSLDDVTGDGLADLLVVSSNNSDYVTTGGAIWVVSGPTTASTDLGAAASATIYGGYTGYPLTRLDIIGDINNDGDMDFGGANYSGDGSAYLFMGPLTGSYYTDSADAQISGDTTSMGFGSEIAPAGDQDGDGIADLLVSAREVDEGEVHLFYGPITAGASLVASDSDEVLTGENADDELGHGMARVGDLDGDGTQDFAICAPNFDGASGSISNSGAIYVLLGPVTTMSLTSGASSNLAVIEGDDVSDRLCTNQVSEGGDFDGDGYLDIVAGAINHDSDDGASYIIMGSDIPYGGTSTITEDNIAIRGESGEGNKFGSVSGGGDIDNDGYDDILIGAQNDDVSGSNSGSANIILGDAN